MEYVRWKKKGFQDFLGRMLMFVLQCQTLKQRNLALTNFVTNKYRQTFNLRIKCINF